jgi:dihydropteroate synthase
MLPNLTNPLPRTLIMGVLNVTPDSFSDGSLFSNHNNALRHARAMEEAGADIIDIGGESTRPGHTPVGAEEEQRRIIPVIRELAGILNVPMSIDTYRAATARAALAAGARIVNDIWGFQYDPDMAATVAEHGAVAVVMHNRAEADPSLNLMADMQRFFERSLDLARRAGIPDTHLILDPGIGFGKTADQNLEALRRLPELRAMGFPVLVGASRKSVLGRFYKPEVSPRDRLYGTLGAHLAAVSRGADILRVHDVKAHVEACRVADILLRDQL